MHAIAATAADTTAATAAATAGNVALRAQQQAGDDYDDASRPASSLPDLDYDLAGTTTDGELTAIQAKLAAAADDLGDAVALNRVTGVITGTPTGAAGALTAAASALIMAADSEHTGFQLRAEVAPGDDEYIVVVAPRNTRTPPRADDAPMTLHAAFRGVIDSSATNPSGIDGTLTGAVPKRSHNINITAPGLLTLETIQTDTIVELWQGVAGDGTPETAANLIATNEMSDTSNHQIVVPVPGDPDTDNEYFVTVSGKTSGELDYLLEMDFKVATGSLAWTDIAVAPGEITATDVDDRDDHRR